MEKLKYTLEKSAFGVCSYLATKMGIASSRVRIYFIYLSFATLGSPIIFYLFIAFWLNVKSYLKRKKRYYLGSINKRIEFLAQSVSFQTHI